MVQDDFFLFEKGRKRVFFSVLQKPVSKSTTIIVFLFSYLIVQTAINYCKEKKNKTQRNENPKVTVTFFNEKDFRKPIMNTNRTYLYFAKHFKEFTLSSLFL